MVSLIKHLNILGFRQGGLKYDLFDFSQRGFSLPPSVSEYGCSVLSAGPTRRFALLAYLYTSLCWTLVLFLLNLKNPRLVTVYIPADIHLFNFEYSYIIKSSDHSFVSCMPMEYAWLIKYIDLRIFFAVL